MMKKKLISPIFLCFLMLTSASLNAQDPANLLDRMIQEHANSISGIETMMVITQMEGIIESEHPDTTYYRKVTMEDGTPTLQPVSSANDAPKADYYNFKQNYDAIVQNSVYEGTQNVDGRTAHVILIEDISALYGDVVGQTNPGEGEPQSGRLFVDSDNYVLLKMQFDMQFEEEYSGSIDINMKDYRNVDGVNYPFLMEMDIEGISEEFSAEDLAEAREGMAELKEQIDNASGIQRRIMERAIRPQIERFERMLEEGGMTMRMVTLAVETNVSIPE
jgi:hypothetical protein